MTDLTIEKLKKLYKHYQNPGMALPEPTEYARGFDQALDLAIGIVMANTSEYPVVGDEKEFLHED